MASFADPPVLPETQPISLDDEAKATQMDHIEELKTQIDDHSMWLQRNQAESWRGQSPELEKVVEAVPQKKTDDHIQDEMQLEKAFDMNKQPKSKPVYLSSNPDVGGEVKSIELMAGSTTTATQSAGLDIQLSDHNLHGESPYEAMTIIANSSHVSCEPSPQTQSSLPDEGSTSIFMDSSLSSISTRSPNSSTSSADPKLKLESENGSQYVPVNSLADPRSVQSPAPTPKRRRIAKESKLQVVDFKARTALPSDIPAEELARQSIEAALASRLNPFVLHPNEYILLRDHICHLHVSAYLGIRNRILRLWVRNPLVTVTPEEAAGCATGTKWLGLAQVAYHWLVRNGYINFGCVEVPGGPAGNRRRNKDGRQTIVVVGAGMSGLGCARQLEGLFSQHSEHWTGAGRDPPRVIVLEGRPRIGGRIYSHPLQNQASKRIPKNLRCTAEMGAHIITGFDHGNPLNIIIRGQLALHYYPLKDNSSLYDVDGRIVNGEQDRLVEQLFNDILDRASVYRHKLVPATTVEGNRELIEAGKDPTGDTGGPISVVEEEKNAIINQPEKLSDKGLDQVPAGMDKLTGKALLVTGSRSKAPAAVAAQKMGWALTSLALSGADLDLDRVANAVQNPTLGQAMDEAIKQYQALLHLSPQDLRLLNWHFANLEYANAANVSKLSLGGWDQDIGNEFEGEHAQVTGGYIQVPFGILQSPHPLDLKTRKTVTHICYSPGKSAPTRARVTCEDGETIEADHVVLTTPLGVLKDNAVVFEPALPSWKAHSIEHLGFGILNKVILVYDKAFWDVDQDMIGLLRDTEPEDSSNQDDYSANRGRFYLFWNCIKTSGRPLLIALMAGDAAVQAESLPDGQIVAEVQHQLCKMFRHKPIPAPTETIVTRWGHDKFARGTYSYVGPSAHSDDYDAMARPVGNLHFAGEATCGTHPATVHGAYISGLRAASEVIEDLLGPIDIPSPLILPTPVKTMDLSSAAELGNSHKPKTANHRGALPDDVLPNGETYAEKQARLESFESKILGAIFTKLGPRPDKPGKAGANPFLLFSKEKWAECKAKCDAARRAALGNAEAKASRNEVRAALGLMWREASDEVKKPYLDQTLENKASNIENAASFQDRLSAWDAEAMSTRREYVAAHPGILSQQEEQDMWQALGRYTGYDRKAKMDIGIADDFRI